MIQILIFLSVFPMYNILHGHFSAYMTFFVSQVPECFSLIALPLVGCAKEVPLITLLQCIQFKHRRIPLILLLFFFFLVDISLMFFYLLYANNGFMLNNL